VAKRDKHPESLIIFKGGAVCIAHPKVPVGFKVTWQTGDTLRN